MAKPNEQAEAVKKMCKLLTLVLAANIGLAASVSHAEDDSVNDAVSASPANYSTTSSTVDLLQAASAQNLMHDDPWMVPFNPADLQNADDWKRQFDVVVVIDKNPNVQRAYIYKSGDLAGIAKVSTGRDRIEYPDPKQKGKPHSLTRPTGSRTYTGYYAPTELIIDEVSLTYEDTKMPWAIYFNRAEGEGNHQAPVGTEWALGKPGINGDKAWSGGCVRMGKQDAHDLFWSVRATGGPPTEAELAKPQFAKELAIEKAKNQFTTYDSMPTIPVFDVHGQVVRDSEGNVKTHKASFKTLYIIEDTSAGSAT